MNDVEVQSICDYLEECLFEPSINWSPEQFAERSYSRWAVSEMSPMRMVMAVIT